MVAASPFQTGGGQTNMCARVPVHTRNPQQSIWCKPRVWKGKARLTNPLTLPLPGTILVWFRQNRLTSTSHRYPRLSSSKSLALAGTVAVATTYVV